MKTNASSGWEWNRRQKSKLAQNERDNSGQCEAVLDGCLGAATEVHHVIERVDGGGDEATNLAAVCEACHYRLTVDANRARAVKRATAKRERKRRNHPGRRDLPRPLICNRRSQAKRNARECKSRAFMSERDSNDKHNHSRASLVAVRLLDELSADAWRISRPVWRLLPQPRLGVDGDYV